ncbi:MAG TPA: GAF domain-containing protein, partial [Candidatus Binatia bacterium]
MSSENNLVRPLPGNFLDDAETGTDLRDRRILCQSDEVAGLLTGFDPSWNISRSTPDATLIKSGAIVVAENANIFSEAVRSAIDTGRVRVIYLLQPSACLPESVNGNLLYGVLTRPVEPRALKSLIDGAWENLALALRQAKLEQDLERAQWEIDQLYEIGIALSTQRDREALLHLILRQCREITHCEAGSLYLVDVDALGERCLRFTITQNDRVDFAFAESFLPLDNSSLAGYVALSGEEVHLEDVYDIPASLPFYFNHKFDEQSGYRSRSMLVVPMKNPQGDITGVVQLINCQRALRGAGNGS